MTKLDEFIEHIIEAFENKILLKVTVGNLQIKNGYLKNVFIKAVNIKDDAMLSFVYRHTDKDITKNFKINEAKTNFKMLLEKIFFNAELYTTSKTIYFTNDQNNKQKIIYKLLDVPLAVKNTTHDKIKKRLIAPTSIYLKALGISYQDGNVKADMQHKYKQINRYVEIIDGILKETKTNNKFSVMDMGSGKGYLTFALFDYLQQQNYDVNITGVEMRDELVNKCNIIAKQSNFTNLHFTKGTIQSSYVSNIDMLIALHACDTATDDAIAKGIKSNVKYIICAPCCHKQIRKQMAPNNALKNITKHGILLERQAEMVTDTIRALLLEANGYKTKVFEFIEEEATPKNVMIVGTKKIFSKKIFDENIEKVNALKLMFGIKEHYLETIL